ncbi:hypothetical protein F5Y16DRAFT_392771 [Xylariaceae sp. FL0255]|nr:hypothetical protein F5Y16DRAFT_392771 [Xylariaceae sp. FL0255]
MLEDKGVARALAPAPIVNEVPQTPNWLKLLRPRPVNTPTGGQDLLRKSRKLAVTYPSFQDPTLRLFSLKASKALDIQAAKVAELEAQNAYLTAKLQRKQQKKRKAVKIAPGQKFVRMADIRRVKRRLRSRVIYNDEASDVDVPKKGTALPDGSEEDLTEIEDCIEIPSGH